MPEVMMSFRILRDAKLRSLFFLLALLFLSGALLRPLNGGGDLFDPEFRTVGKETESVQIIGALVYMVSIGLMLWQLGKLRLHRELGLVVAIVLLAVCSAYWADEPSVSIRRSIALAGTSIFGLALAQSLDRRQIISLLNLFALLFFAVSVVLAVVLPDFSFHDVGFATFAGALRGPFNHKNDMGTVIGFLLTIVVVSGSRCMSKSVWLSTVAVGSVLLLATLSMGSVISVIAGIGGAYIIAKIAINPSYPYRVLFWLVVFFTAAFLGFFWNDLFEFVLGALGRDATLSDRTLVWNLVIISGQDKWLLGSGYGVAWLGGAADTVKSGLYASINNAHNGFLEIWLQLGVVGVALVALLLIAAGVKVYANLRSLDDETFGRMSIAILIYIIVENITAVHLLSYNDLKWSLIVVVAYLADFRVSSKSSRGARGRAPQLQFQGNRPPLPAR